nr:hypothetical protein [Tanacetum cinerariifolium]
PRPGGHQKRLRPRPMRHLHRAARRPAPRQLPVPGRGARGSGHYHRGGLGRGRQPKSLAAGVSRLRCLPMRLLHAGPALLGAGAFARRPRP